jgi:hypothetical protein
MRQVPNVRRPSSGSSTGAPGFPTGLQDTRSQYNPATSGVNPATGAGYQKHQAPPVPERPSNSYDQGGYDAGTHTQHAQYPQHASTTQPTGLENQTTAGSGTSSDKYAQKGENFGRKAHGVMAGIHVSIPRKYTCSAGPPSQHRYVRSDLTLNREPENHYGEL